MAFWKYIGEFLLFRWLLGKFRKSTTEHDTHAEGLRTSVDSDGESLYDNHDEDIVQNDRAATPVGDESIDDSDNSEDLDDLDIFMRNNNGNYRSHQSDENYDSSDYHSRSRYSSHNDWDSGSYSQSYDDFLDEQDDYDMMDDDF